MGLIRAAAILAVDNRCRTASLEFKCLGTSFGGAKQKFQSLGTQHGHRVIKAYALNVQVKTLYFIHFRNVLVHSQYTLIVTEKIL